MKPTIHPRYRDIKSRTLSMLEESDRLSYAIFHTHTRDACSIYVYNNVSSEAHPLVPPVVRIILSSTESGHVVCMVKIGKTHRKLEEKNRHATDDQSTETLMAFLTEVISDADHGLDFTTFQNRH
jgi:hypothetical protein